MNKIKREEREDLHTFSDTTEVAVTSITLIATIIYLLSADYTKC